jgi:NAD(P)-dependent dehydrogenase (short-subunit alcohol dehydrogenase family)
MRMDCDLEGKWFVITGANTGIGRVTAEKLAKRGAEVTLACRSEEKTRPVVDAICAAGGKADFDALDLADLSSVRASAARLSARGRPLDVLVANAGLAGPRGLTRDGFELTFGTNHLGHFLFTVLLAPRLGAAKGARVVVVSSKMHRDVKQIDWDALREPTRTITAIDEYRVSKLANILFASELARRLGPDGPHTYSLHPGVVASDIYRQLPWPIRPLVKLGMIPVEEGAETSLHCAASAEAASETGLYYVRCKPRAPGALARDAALARELWEKSVGWTGTDLS